MKRIISMLLIFVMLLSLCACGSDEKADSKNENTVQINEEPAEATLSPREQFEQNRQAMEELKNKNNEAAADATPVTYSTAGITYTLDSAFTTSNTNPESTNVTYTSTAMWITAQALSNVAGYTTSQQAAEDIAALQGGEVNSQNGIYYVEEDGNVRAYYADGSGYYWCIYGFVTGGNDYNTYRSRLIDFCTSGKID